MLKMPTSSTLCQDDVSGDSKDHFILSLCNEFVVHKNHIRRMQMKSLTFIGLLLSSILFNLYAVAVMLGQVKQ